MTTAPGPSLSAACARLAAGTHHDPHRLLGPHPTGGAVVVRFFHPEVVEVVRGLRRRGRADAAGRRARPFRGGRSRQVAGRLPAALPQRRRQLGDGRPLPLLALPGRSRPPPDQRGHPSRALAPAGGEGDGAPGGGRGRLRGLGAQRPRGRPGERRQRVGRPCPADALARGQRGLGALRPRDRRGDQVQVPGGAGRRASRRQGRPDGAADEPPPRTPASSSRAPTGGPTTPGCSSGRPQPLLDRPISIYEVHLGSWRRSPRRPPPRLPPAGGGAGRVLRAERLHPRRAAPGERASLRRLVGLPGDQLLRPDRPLRHPRRLPRLRGPPPPARAWGSSSTGCPAHFPKDDWALARFDGTALYEHADPRRGEQPDWGTLVFNFGRSEVRNFLIANARFWIEEFHVDGLRVDAVASMLYLDYSRKAGEWLPNQYGGQREPRGHRLAARVQRGASTATTRAWSASPRSRQRGPGVPPDLGGGLGFSFKWNMGWMHDTLEYMSQGPGPPSLPPRPDDLRFPLRVDRELRAAPLPRRGGARQGVAARPDVGRPLAAVRQPPRLFGWMCALPRQEAPLHGGRVRPGRRMGHDRSLDWHLVDFPEHRGLQRLVQDLGVLYRETPALWERDHSPRASAGSTPQRGSEHLHLHPARGRGRPGLVCVANFSPATTGSASAYRLPDGGARW